MHSSSEKGKFLLTVDDSNKTVVVVVYYALAFRS